MDEELIHFLKNIGLGQHINKFSEEEVMSMNTLMILSDAHISSLLPKIGHQAILKDAIQKSKAANLKRNITTASKLKLNKNNSESMKPRIQNFLPGPSSTAFKKYSASPQPDISPQKSYHSGINCDVLECISMNRTGRAILNSYEQNNYLLPSQRKLLVHIVVEHLMQQSTRLVSQHFQLAASNIVRIFPSEAIETYFIPRSGTNGKSCANGLLLKRYKNQRSLLISQGIISKSSDKESYEIFVPLDSVDPSLLIPKREEMEDQVKIEEEPLGFLEEPWSDDSSPYERSSNHSPSPTHDQMSEWDSSKHTQSDLDSISAVNAFIANRTNLVDTEIIHNSFPGPSSGFKRFTDSVNASPPKRFCSDEMTVNCDVRRAIGMSSAGQAILKSYEQNNYLLPTQRKHLVHIVVEHLMQQSSRLLGQHFQIAASNIVKLFPTEAPETYFVPCSESARNSATGMLPTRYKNRRMSLINQGIISKSTSKERSKASSTNDSNEHGIDKSAFDVLTKEHIQCLIPQIGIQAKLQHKLTVYQKSLEETTSTASTLSVSSVSDDTEAVGLKLKKRSYEDVDNLDIESEVSHPSKKPNVSSKFEEECLNVDYLPNSAVLIDIPKVVLGNPFGRLAADNYYKQKQLLTSDRKLIVKLVAEDMLRQSIKLTSNDFILASKKICDFFKTEHPETYFIPFQKPSTQAKGMLVDKYRYLKKKYSKMSILNKSNNVDETSLDEDETANDKGFLDKVQWLKSHSEPDVQIIKYWTDTCLGRKKSLKHSCHTTANAIIEEWPSLKLSIAPKLIQIDFEHSFPGKSGALLDNWISIRESLEQFLKKDNPDPTKSMVLDNLDCGPVRNRDYFLLKLLVTLLPPTVVTCNKKKWHPTVCDAQDAFILHVKDSSDIENILQERKSRLHARGQTYQPFVLSINESQESHKKIFIVIDEYKFPVSSFIEAVDKLFKLFFVFNLKYPVECQQVWTFIQTGIFKITSRFDIKSPKITTLISNLKL